jgi:allantoin racemase
MKPRVAILGSGVRWTGARPPAYLESAGAAAELVGVGLGASVFPYTPAEHVLAETIHLDAGLRALEGRPGAILIDTFGEYAIDALRAATVVPVVGAAEAALAEAARRGPRFAIVTVWPASMAWLYASRLARHDAARSCVGVHHVGPAGVTAAEALTGGVLVPGQRSASPLATDVVSADAFAAASHGAVDRVREQVAAGSEALFARVVGACHAAIAAGADSIVLGCTCMAPMYEQLAATLPAPVVCASRAGLERAVELATRGETPWRTPDPVLAARARAAVAAIAAAGRTGPLASDAADVPPDAGTGCPVCVD